MTIFTARVQVSTTPISDTRMSVNCKDQAGLAAIGTDFIFDFSQPACYPGGTLPAVGTPPASGVFTNLARNVQPLIIVEPEPGGRTSAVTTGAFGTLPTYDGKGLRFTNGQTPGLYVRKEGINETRVCENALEGFVSVLEIVWLTSASTVAQSSPYLRTNNTGGWEQRTDNRFAATETGDDLTSSLNLGEPIMLAKIIRFDTAAGTSTIRSIFGTGGLVTAREVIPGRTIADYPANQFAYALIGARNSDPLSTMNATIHRVMREYIDPAGFTDEDMIARLRSHYAWGAARFA